MILLNHHTQYLAALSTVVPFDVSPGKMSTATNRNGRSATMPRCTGTEITYTTTQRRQLRIVCALCCACAHMTQNRFAEATTPSSSLMSHAVCEERGICAQLDQNTSCSVQCESIIIIIALSALFAHCCVVCILKSEYSWRAGGGGLASCAQCTLCWPSAKTAVFYPLNIMIGIIDYTYTLHTTYQTRPEQTHRHTAWYIVVSSAPFVSNRLCAATGCNWFMYHIAMLGRTHHTRAPNAAAYKRLTIKWIMKCVY